MQQFVLCALAALMCVLCFAAGFVVAVLLRLADHSWFGRASASSQLQERTPHPQEMPPTPMPVAVPELHEVPATPTPTPTPVAVPEVPAAAMSVAVPLEPPAQPEQWFLSAIPASVPEQHHEVTPQPAAQVPAAHLPAAHLPAEHPMSRETRDVATTSPPRTPGKVFLFGDPSDEHVAPPSLAPVRPRPLSHGGSMQQQPLILPPAEVDLLPRRP